MIKDTWLLSRILLLVPALVGTVLSFSHTGLNVGLGETGRAAISLLHHGLLGDPYLLPTGPTAHVSPAHAAYLAAVFWLFGENTPAARAAPSLVCVGLWPGSAYLGIRIGERLRLEAIGIGVIVFWTCLWPFFLPDAVIQYRQWDQPFAAFLLALPRAARQ